MKVRLSITKHGKSLYTGVYNIEDADGFGKACADAWWRLRQEQVGKETSIGALMEHLDGNVLNQLNGAHLSLERT